MQPFMEALQSMGWATALRESALMYPIILSLHLTGMGLFGGMIAMTDLRILGLAFRGRPAADVHNQLRAFKHLGLTLVVICGALIGTSKAGAYWPNPFFKLKLTLLLIVAVHALVFRGSVYKKLDEFDRAGIMPGNAKLAAALSLVLWIGLVAAGRWIGYWEPEQEF
jgi:hypothetical protein